MGRELLCAIILAAFLGLDQVAEGRPRTALLPPGKYTSWHKSPPPRRAPPQKASVPSPKATPSSPAVVPESPLPAPNPSPRSQAQPRQNPPPIALPREGNGVRLVGGSGARGRLEVSSVDGWLNEYEEGAVAWRPVCNMVGFDDSYAQIMCELLGYQYGRLYYDDEVNRRAPNDTATDYDMPVENLDCQQNLSPPTSQIDSGPAGGRRLLGRRALLRAFPVGTVDIPADAPYRCEFDYRSQKSCDYTGPLVGVECSFLEFPPAPPPPPSPPSPPDAPPSRKAALHTYGSGMGTYDPLESNLCVPPAADAPDPEAAAEEYAACTGATRADLVVADPAGGGGEVFAALCAIDDNEDLALLVADTVCKQNVDYPASYSAYDSTVLPSLQIPDADAPADALPPVFKSGAYANKWVTITGGEPNANYPALQQMEYTVGSSCANGRLFAFRCSYRSS
ncbi:hypothetical protein HXX76_008361 [Chlamydomonas incerta]|uniref:SRCR domain-containing protein n=1 Tax=Chlamydomonas incerta TaxID=51695 RepID=A0A835T3Q8_CHLIN|nr:hypothetical protein HXX76_008361 [Chlamydomonas incerta]|eukprot:KAG2433294.1 hypothetical protein HXX76_008361 [Chlamydomonas incerta]